MYPPSALQLRLKGGVLLKHLRRVGGAPGVQLGGKLSVLAAALCDSGLSREEIEELRGLLERDEL